MLADESKGEFFDVSESEIESIFHTILLSLGILTSTPIKESGQDDD